jgi:hypothetical protein
VLLLSIAEASFIMVETGVPNLDDGNLAFGDYDKDGDLDIMTIGLHQFQGVSSSQARLYRNDGNWQFTESGFVFDNFVSGGVSFVDYDNDGWLDIALSGSPYIAAISGQVTLFHNNAGLSFTPVDFPFYNYRHCNHICADVDNDFDLDFLIIGSNLTLDMYGDLCIYYNLGNGEFQYDSLSGLPNFTISRSGYISAIDFDRDGYHDLSIGAGRIYGGISSPRTQVWRRTPFGIYESVFGDDIGGGSGFQWFDYDNDGDLDFLYTGYQNNLGPTTLLYSKDNGLYVNIPHTFPNIMAGDVAAADYDNDGDEDIFVTGEGSSAFSTIASLYRNDGNAVFIETNLGLHPVEESYACWVDLDNDGDLDLAYTEIWNGWTMFYRNDTTVQNQQPTAPTLNYDIENGFSFSGAIDSATPPHALTYDLRIGTSPGAADVYHPMADLVSGYRRIPGAGRPSFNKHQLTPGKVYYAAAQAIDGCFAGSAWGEEITIDLSVGNDDQLQAPLNMQMYPNPFSSKINISYKAQPSTSSEAGIYNLRGQFVCNLHSYLKGESFELSWDGKNESGIQVSNGVYVLRLKQDGKLSAHKIVLIK